MLRDLVLNAAVLISGLYAGSLLFRNVMFPDSPWRERLLYGIFQGVNSALLIVLHGQAAEGYALGFYVIPIILSALYSGGAAAIVTSLIAAAVLFLVHHGSVFLYSPLTIALTGFGCSLIAVRWNNRWARLSVVTFFALAMHLIGFGIDIGWESLFWEALVLFSSCFIGVAFAADMFVHFDYTRRTLEYEKAYLTQHDVLTGLLNFQTFQVRLQQLLLRDERLCFVLIDCDDVKSLNFEQGTDTVDNTLQQVALLLRACFPQAWLMARYGSDEFAVVFPASEMTPSFLEDILERQIPERADIQLSYGYAVFPDEEQDPAAFTILVQQRLMETKRRFWLEREAHWLHNERLKAVGQLAAGMAHEIRNPLTTVKGFLQVSRENNYNIAAYYDIIMHEIKRMSELTAEFLQFSKPNEHRPKRLSLQECLYTVMQLTESEIVSQGHQLEFDVDETPLYAMIDKDKISQVLVNLVRNALEAMNRSGMLTVSVFQRGEFGVIEVSDTGTGIAPEHLDLLFQPFFSTKSKGTGLGLSISQKIVNEHGGFISVRSREGKGTTFTIRIPLAVMVESAV